MSDVTTSVSTDNGNPVTLAFVDISNEKYRTYTIPTGFGLVNITIENPVKLNVKRKDNGDSHRVVDAQGKSYYIPAGWVALAWEGKNGEAFSF